jgi:hypothetical protein
MCLKHPREEEDEVKAFPAFGRGGSLKIRYVLAFGGGGWPWWWLGGGIDADLMAMIVRMMCALLMNKL